MSRHCIAQLASDWYWDANIPRYSTRIAHASMSIICLLLLLGTIWSSYNISIQHGTQKWAAAWHSFPSLVFVMHGWLVSWGQLQAYILTPDQASGIRSPGLANSLFVGIGGALAAGVIVCHQLFQPPAFAYGYCRLAVRS